MPIRYLSEKVLERLDISTASMVVSIEKAILDMADRRAWTAPKSVVLPEDGRYVMTTLAASDDPPYMAVKAVILNPHNAARGLPSINGVVTLLDSHSGKPLALIDGKWVTAVRTAGLSLLAGKYLARRDATNIVFLGCGVQARAHLSVFANTYPLKTALLFGRGQDNIDRLAALAQSFGLAVRYARDANEALSEADLIVSSLTRDPSRAPFLDARLIRPGAFATITDLAEPWQQDGLAAFDRIFVDDSEQERAASVKLAAPDLIRGDLSDLALRRETGRNQDSERTAFIFRGYGLADLAIAGLALREAEKTNLGLVIDSDE
jgi:ornithine cyclodeaminase/alanine dehydrogenase